MTAHTMAQREFIALRLARFEPPQDIVTAFLAQWRDTACTLPDVAACDPAHGAVLAPETFEAFKRERERILTDPHAAPTSDRRARLIALHRMYEKARDNNQVALAAELLAQIATETDTENGKAPVGAGAVIKAIVRTIIDPAPVAVGA